MTPELWSIVLTHCVTGLVTCCGLCLALVFVSAFIQQNQKTRVALLDDQVVQKMKTLNNLNSIIERRQEVLGNPEGMKATYLSDEKLQKMINEIGEKGEITGD